MSRYMPDSLLFPYIRFLNASPQGGALDFYVGSTLVAAGIKFLSFTPYIKTCTGMQCVKFTRSGRKDEVAEKLCFNQKPGEVKLITVSGKADKAHFFVLDEPREANTGSFCNIRFCNLCPEDEGMDVYINGVHCIGDINFKETSKYLPLQKGDVSIEVNCNGKKIIKAEKGVLKKDNYCTYFIAGLKSEHPHICKTISTDAGSYKGFYL